MTRPNVGRGWTTPGDMDMVRQIGGTRIAAPPSGATKEAVHLLRAAERYRALLEIGDKIGVTPQVELWGFSRSLNRLGETAFVAMESGHPARLHPGRRLSPLQGRVRIRRSAQCSTAPPCTPFT